MRGRRRAARRRRSTASPRCSSGSPTSPAPTATTRWPRRGGRRRCASPGGCGSPCSRPWRSRAWRASRPSRPGTRPRKRCTPRGCGGSRSTATASGSRRHSKDWPRPRSRRVDGLTASNSPAPRRPCAPPSGPRPRRSSVRLSKGCAPGRAKRSGPKKRPRRGRRAGPCPWSRPSPPPGGRPRGCPGSRLRAALPDAMLLSRCQAPDQAARVQRRLRRASGPPAVSRSRSML